MSGATKRFLGRRRGAEVLSDLHGAGRRARWTEAPRRTRTSEPARDRSRSRAGHQRGRSPAHYKVICISLYNEDLERLDGMVDELKTRGSRKRTAAR